MAEASLGSSSHSDDSQKSLVSISEINEVRQMRNISLVVTVIRKFPWTVFLTGMILSGLASYLSLGFFAMDDPLAGLRIRDHVSAERSDAHIQTLLNIRPNMGGNSDTKQYQNSKSGDDLIIIYHAKKGTSNVFTVDNVARMKELEESLVGLTGYRDYCLRDMDKSDNDCSIVLSPTRYLSNATTQQEIDEKVREMWLDRNRAKDGTMLHFCQDFNNVTNIECGVTKTKIRFGLPLKGYLNANDRPTEQNEKLDDWLWDQGFFNTLESFRSKSIQDPVNNMYMTFFQQQMFDHEVLVILGDDIMFAAYSLCIIWLLGIFYLQSIFLASMALLHITISFPVAFFIYRVVFGIELFGGLNFISLYLLLGIGCDDVFIYTDALKQSKMFARGPGWTFEKRLGWAYGRASFTMTATTITTGLAFLMLAMNEVPIIKYFGIYTSILLFVNFMMVIIIYTSIIVIYHDHFGGFGENTRWVPTIYPQVHDEVEGSIESSEGHDPPTMDMPPSRLGVFFKQVYTPKFINTRKGRFGVISVAALLAIVSIIMASQLKISKQSLKFWADDHYFWVALDSDKEFKKGSQPSNTIRTVYGLKPPFIDRTGTKESASADYGTPIYDGNFDLANPQAQVFLRDQCLDVVYNKTESLKLESFDKQNRYGRCVMPAFALWRKARNESFPMPINTAKENSLAVGIEAPSVFLDESFNELMLEFLGRPQFAKKYFANVGFKDTANGLYARYLFDEYAAEIKRNDAYSDSSAFVEVWDDHMEQVNSKLPASIQGGEAYYTDSLFYFFTWSRTQSRFLPQAFISITLSLLLAFSLTCLATHNWMLSLITCGVISLVLLNVFGLLYIAGFQIGAIETTILTLVIGVSIDYQLHLVIGYSDGKLDHKIDDREGRCKHALVTLGPSILAGAMTTILSTSALFFATIAFFPQFAFMMVSAAIIAVIYGLVLLPALLSTIGPEKEQGEIYFPPCMNVASDVDSSKSTSFATRSISTTRRSLLGYLVILLVLGSLSVAMYLVRANEIKKIEISKGNNNENNLEDGSIKMPDFSDLSVGQWTEFHPGNDTMCARGTPYAFFVRKGLSDAPMILEFEGGGGCWNPSTCQSATGTFSDTVEGTRASFRRAISGKQRPTGMFDEQGPYVNFTHVYIPYCTGDLHWGNSIVNYSESLTLHHKGSVNARAVLKYIQSQIPAPSRILVTGCSAGAYGSWLWSQWVSKMYEDSGETTKVIQMGDSGVGIVSDSFLSESFVNWNVIEGGAFPMFIVPEDYPMFQANLTAGMTSAKLYEWGALRFPNHTFGQASTAYDWNQAFFLKTMEEGKSAELFSADKAVWNNKMNSLYDSMAISRPPNLVHWVAPGDYHCAIGPRHYYADFVGVPYFERLYNYFMNDTAYSFDCRDLSIDYCKQGVDLRDEIEVF